MPFEAYERAFRIRLSSSSALEEGGMDEIAGRKTLAIENKSALFNSASHAAMIS